MKSSQKILKALAFMLSAICLVFVTIGILNGSFMDVAGGLSLATIPFAFTNLAEITSVEPNDGDENMGGFGQVMYIGLRSHIATYPTIPAQTTPATMDELVALQGSFTFATDKNFIKVFVAPETLSVDPESQGEYPGAKSFRLKGSFIIPGMKGTQRAMARILNNSYGVVVIPEEDGTRMCYGTELRPVHFTPKGKSGKKAADTKNFEYEFVTDSFVPGYTYNGTIVLDGTTLPAVS